MSARYVRRPDGSNWGDFGLSDQHGRLNLITPERRRAAAVEVQEGLAFCLSLPLDCPATSLNPRRDPPRLEYPLRGEDPVINYPYGVAFPGMKEVVSDDRVTLSLQYSTQWDALCHMGYLYDGQADGREEVTYYNGFTAPRDVVGPVDYLRGKAQLSGPYGAKALGIERIAETCVQGRGVMIDLHAHLGLREVAVGYRQLMEIMRADGVQVEPGDLVCFRTGFDRALLASYADPRVPLDPRCCAGLDGFDERLLQWLSDCGASALISDNQAVEIMPDFKRETTAGIRVPLHHHCLFKLGMPLGECFLLSDLADWLRANGRSRFMLTAPPLRLPGAVGSPVTGVATV